MKSLPGTFVSHPKRLQAAVGSTRYLRGTFELLSVIPAVAAGMAVSDWLICVKEGCVQQQCSTGTERGHEMNKYHVFAKSSPVDA